MPTQPIYIVASLHRSGSAMMMRCLEHGGMEVICDQSADAELEKWFGKDDYDPNPHGFYQAPAGLIERPDFIEYASGKVFKLYVRDILKLPVANYKIILMRRAKAEIIASMMKLSDDHYLGSEQDDVILSDVLFPEILAYVATRPDITLVEVPYASVVDNPVLHFTRIKNRLDIPIDIVKAAAMVQPSLYRFRLETL